MIVGHTLGNIYKLTTSVFLLAVEP